ncbi:MAG: O-acetylhomoserine aminocarboxypropyltransferase/cysteine synthase family protein [Gammaproteobacteria bacterium WSBS_2016_MAG_OTU1]
MSDRQFGLETLCAHAGQTPDSDTGSRAPPIYQTVSYVFDTPEHAASLFNLQTFGNVYTRLSNPTTAMFEERMATVEKGRAAVATASGMAAEAVAMLALLQQGDEVVAAKTLYGGSYSLLDFNFRKLGITTHFVDADDVENFARAITPKTRLIFAETLGNPAMNVLDIQKTADIARAAGVPLMVDNTIPSPWLCRPIEWGADIVVHSATKYIGGHGAALGGVIIESGKFPWDNGKFPGMVEPSPGYHGVRFYETFGDFGYTMRARCEILRTYGSALSPMHSFMFLQGLETLPLRMQRHSENALAVAEFLSQHPKVSWVNYPFLKSSRYYDLAQRYMPAGGSGILTFGIVGGAAAGASFIDNVQLCSHLANIGDTKTLVIHPASTTHRQMNEEQQKNAGILPEMIRLSVGVETIDDILWDLDQAICAAG